MSDKIEEPIELRQRMRGRAKFLRDRGEIKTPELLEKAIDVIDSMLQPYAYDAIGYIDGVEKAKSLHYSKDDAEKFIKFLIDHGYSEVKIISLFE